jgi:hypothetical protein
MYPKFFFSGGANLIGTSPVFKKKTLGTPQNKSIEVLPLAPLFSLYISPSIYEGR